MQGMCHQQSLTVPFFRAGGARSPHVLMANTSNDALSVLQTRLLQPAFYAQAHKGVKMEGRKDGEEMWGGSAVLAHFES